MFKHFHKVLLLVFTLFSITGQSQNAFKSWYFGSNTGLDFSVSPPNPISTSSINTVEGCASISDASGNLLFYSDGVSVWDRSHHQMPNGNKLWGHKSSTQSASIIPFPGSSNLFYVFTIGAQVGSIGSYSGLSYSIVDMSLNGGMGDVTSKNIPVVANTVEKISIVPHCNNEDFWVVTHLWNSNEFYAIPLTISGLGSPIISSVGETFSGSTISAAGYLKVSSNGKKLALVSSTNDFNNLGIYAFDNSSGVVSEPLEFLLNGKPYGVSFSPNHTKLYVSFIESESVKLCQFDLEAGEGNPDSILLSKYDLIESHFSYGALQIGPDGKIYVARNNQNHIGVIHDPDEIGANCNYIDEGIFLESNELQLGLPVYIETKFHKDTHVNFSFASTSCSDFETQFIEEYSITCDSITSFTWDFGDGSPITDGKNPIHTYSSGGLYSVTLTVTTASGVYSKTKNVSIKSNRVPDFTFNEVCIGGETQFESFVPCSPSTYFWDLGDGTIISEEASPAHNYAGSGVYTVKLHATWPDGYTSSITKSVEVLDPIGNADFTYFLDCSDKVVFYDKSEGGPVSWTWNFMDGSPLSFDKNPVHTFKNHGSFPVKLIVEYENSCQSDTIVKMLDLEKQLSISGPETACQGEELSFYIGFAMNEKLVDKINIDWKDGNFEHFNGLIKTIKHVFDNPGSYQPEFTIFYKNNNCLETLTKNIIVKPGVNASFSIDDTAFCENETIYFTGNSSGAVESWLWQMGDGNHKTGSSSINHLFENSGTYNVSLKVQNAGGCSNLFQKKINILEKPVANFSFAAPYCEEIPITFMDKSSGDIINWAWNMKDGTYYNEMDPEHTFMEPGKYPIELIVENFDGCFDKVQSLVEVKAKPNVWAGDDQTIWQGQSALLIGQGGDKFTWYPYDLVFDNHAQSISVKPNATTDYILEVKDENECKAKDTVRVNVINNPGILVPNYYSPETNANEYFQPTITGDVQMKSFRIYNRWGKLIFESNDPGVGWDGNYNGKPQPTDTYIYTIVAESPLLARPTINGSFSLIR